MNENTGQSYSSNTVASALSNAPSHSTGMVMHGMWHGSRRILVRAAYNTAGLFLPVANTGSNANGGASVLIAALELVMAAIIVVAASPRSFRGGNILRPK